MKCPKCEAKLLPVDGEMFCLQCGTLVAVSGDLDAANSKLEETIEPLLQAAISDVSTQPVSFVPPPAAVVPEIKESVAKLPDKPHSDKPHTARPRRVKARRLVRRGSMATALVVGVLAVVNLGLASYYRDRVYPGVRVGGVAIGGMRLVEVPAVLAESEPNASITVVIGTTKSQLNRVDIGPWPDMAAQERAIKDIGRTAPLPLAGVVASMTMPAVEGKFMIDQSMLDAQANKLASAISFMPSDAMPMIVAGRAFMFSDKTGLTIMPRQVSDAIADAVEKNASVATITPEVLHPRVSVSAYAADLAAAQACLALNVRIVAKGNTYTLSASQIGDMLAFLGPGKGLGVDKSKVAAFVASVPGSFDRAAAATTVLDAVKSGKSVTVNAAAKPVTATPAWTGF